MKHRPYCCEASRDLYENYYAQQNGGEIPVLPVVDFNEDTDWVVSLAVSSDDSCCHSSKPMPRT